MLLDKLLHAVHSAVMVRTGQHLITLLLQGELLVGLRDGAWLRRVSMRIHWPKMRRELTAWKDCDPPLTRATAPVDTGSSQSAA